MQIKKPIESFTPHKINFGKVVIIDAHDSFTYNLVQAFLGLGAQVVVVSAFAYHLITLKKQNPDYLVLSPGPKTPSHSGIMKAAVKHFYGKKPILAICLGLQVVNEVFGGKTLKANNLIHGATSQINHNNSGVFLGINNPTVVARYHSLQAVDINKSFVIQAKADDMVMAFHQPKIIAALQFHPESFMTKEGSAMLNNFLQGNF